MCRDIHLFDRKVAQYCHNSVDNFVWNDSSWYFRLYRLCFSPHISHNGKVDKFVEVMESWGVSEDNALDETGEELLPN